MKCFIFPNFLFSPKFTFSHIHSFLLILPVGSVCGTVFSVFFTQAFDHWWSLYTISIILAEFA